jgi:hypothetical protein
MELPSFSYRAARAGLTRWPDPESETELHFTAELPDPLFPTSMDAAAPVAKRPAAAPGEAAAREKAAAGVDAARHAVLRRLAPALKHDMVVNLQAVSMMAEMLNARLERSGPESADLQANISKLNRLAREAVLKCLNVSSWIDPGEDDTVSLTRGVQECVTLMGGSLNFRGYNVVNEVPEIDFDVCRSSLRNLLASSLMTLADTCPSPSILRIGGEVSAGFAAITLSCEPQGDEADRLRPEPPAVRVDWADMQALAAADSAELHRNADRIVMRLPRAMPSSPLRMAPI